MRDMMMSGGCGFEPRPCAEHGSSIDARRFEGRGGDQEAGGGVNVKANDGGPAFPLAVDTHSQQWCDGMTLRDYFAGQVLAGSDFSKTVGLHNEEALVGMAREIYQLADAMLKARDA